MSRLVDWFINGQVDMQVIVRMLALRRGGMFNGMGMAVAVIVMRMSDLQVEMASLANAGLQTTHAA